MHLATMVPSHKKVVNHSPQQFYEVMIEFLPVLETQFIALGHLLLHLERPHCSTTLHSNSEITEKL